MCLGGEDHPFAVPTSNEGCGSRSNGETGLSDLSWRAQQRQQCEVWWSVERQGGLRLDQRKRDRSEEPKHYCFNSWNWDHCV